MPQHRALVVGGGSIGEWHVRCFDRTGRAEVALCEIDEAVRQQVAQKPVQVGVTSTCPPTF